MSPTMYLGYALVLCLISISFPFDNQTLSIAGNNPPNGEQIEYKPGKKPARHEAHQSQHESQSNTDIFYIR